MSDSEILSSPKRSDNITMDNLILGKSLGFGAYSQVLHATHKNTGVEYAVKVMAQHKIIQENKVTAVMNERNVMKMVSHPNVTRLVSTFKTDSDLYFVLEYAENGELASYIKRMCGFPVATTQRVAAELVSALEALHVQHIVHRDLKPENCLFDSNWHIKLCDFGMATVSTAEPLPLDYVETPEDEDETNNNNVPNNASSSTSSDSFRRPDSSSFSGSSSSSNSSPADLTTKVSESGSASRKASKSFVGTAHYVSPELLSDFGATYSSDLWALGCIIYQMETGRRPFQDGSDWLVFEKILKCNVVYPASFSPAAKDLCQKLLVRCPTKRLGVGPNGYAALKMHPFFEGIDFSTLSAHHHTYEWNPKAPVWVADKNVDACTGCEAPFTFWLRKHHCRACGNVFCAPCSCQRRDLPELGHTSAVRVCRRCFSTWEQKMLSPKPVKAQNIWDDDD